MKITAKFVPKRGYDILIDQWDFLGYYPREGELVKLIAGKYYRIKEIIWTTTDSIEIVVFEVP